MPRDPFNPPTKRQAKSCPSAKTLTNRKYQEAKRGLDVAHSRDDSAFRTAKHRKLAVLHKSKQWSELSEMQRAKLEKEIIATLEAKRDKKMRLHEMQWMKKVEDGEVSSGEECNVEMEHEDAGVEQTISVDDNEEEGEDEEWETSSEGKNEDNKDYQGVYAPTFAEDFETIKQAAKQGWVAKMKVFEESAISNMVLWRQYSGQ
jgi:hypothetical protein